MAGPARLDLESVRLSAGTRSPEGTRCAWRLRSVPGVGRSRETGCLLLVAAAQVPTDPADSRLVTSASGPKAFPWQPCLQPGVYRFDLFAACRLWEPDALLKCYPVSLFRPRPTVALPCGTNPVGLVCVTESLSDQGSPQTFHPCASIPRPGVCEVTQRIPHMPCLLGPGGLSSHTLSFLSRAHIPTVNLLVFMLVFW